MFFARKTKSLNIVYGNSRGHVGTSMESINALRVEDRAARVTTRI